MSSEKNIAIIIPAAGSSSRMGEPKQLLKWKNSNLLEHAIQTASSLNVNNIVVVLGAFSELIESQTNLDGVHVCFNADWEIGLGKSISYGVLECLKEFPETDGIMVMLGDQPLIGADYLNQLILHFKSSDPMIVASQYGDHYGVPAVFDKRLFAELKRLDFGKGAKGLINKHRKNVQAITERPNLVDIDTKEQYQKLYNANHQS